MSMKHKDVEKTDWSDGRKGCDAQNNFYAPFRMGRATQSVMKQQRVSKD